MTRSSLLLAVAGSLLVLAALLPAAPVPAGEGPPAAPGATPPIEALAERGRLLFTAKGCATCHSHSAVAAEHVFTMNGPPDLTNYPANPLFLRTWLADPQAVRPGTPMPNLGLSEADIEALIAFLVR